ncbi:MAG TPA: formate hydrogenlyase [Deltaproteobacteria bacterium]|nr:MAG: formate hydrogenlyase [Deltaproteobacteria bacterium GWA2_55_82]OGQ64872.1 MAG: formate hydrogenlyase [Deltaproteobacteria bacterium RIFCSPLOWO2_02_FULL_55_12]OIJ73939.1 MAG: formate hydrogenlyase [Deltaproteobacteria bacterium GWC2_55_46]HBG46534.1 formate hydrogenlyase [Deltaproteobacteria bacterium]HCY09936.1 formate hydrogenlyase [Deltaproteobacteria bacterium]
MDLSLAAQLNSVLAALILLASFGLLVQRRINGLLHIFAWQGLFLSMSTAVVGYSAGLSHLYISAILTLILKVFALPYILYTLIHRLKIHKEVEYMVNIPATMLIGIALVIFSYHLTSPIMELSTLVTRSTLAVALSTVMLGLLMMITRRKAVTQIVGFLSLENGLFFAATSATYGMPLVVELGVALDILIAAFIFGIFFFQIRTTFDSLDLKEMEKLKEDE